MTRLAMAGCEAAVDELNFNVTGATRDTTHARTGACWACDSGAGNATSFIGPLFPSPSASTNYFLRAYMRFDNAPASTVKVMTDPGLTTWSLRLTAAGALQLFNDSLGTQIGSDSAAITFGSGIYYRLEIGLNFNASTQVSQIEAKLDGSTIATSGALTLAGSLACDIGWFTAPGANAVCYVDDFALNDSTGASQNSYPGSGKVLLLLPTADSAKGLGWVNDANGTTNFFNATKNTPPQGIADTTASTGLHQIRNGTANANSSYDATVTTYTAAGVGASDTVNAVFPATVTGAPVVTSAKTGTIGSVSNPTIANIAFVNGGSAAANFWSGVAAGTYPTGWKWEKGTVASAPTVTLGTAPVVRVTQVTSSTRIAMVCFVGMYVDYTPAVVATVMPPRPTVVLQAVNRASRW